jgi:hypothetical protein
MYTRKETEKNVGQASSRISQLRLAFLSRPPCFDSGQRAILADSTAGSGMIGEDLAEGEIISQLKCMNNRQGAPIPPHKQLGNLAPLVRILQKFQDR